MAQLSLQDDKLRRCWPQLSQNCFFLKMVRFEMVNLGLCFTVKIGFQSADSIITNGLKEEFDISGIYTLLVAVIAYFVLLRMLLLDLFSTSKYRKTVDTDILIRIFIKERIKRIKSQIKVLFSFQFHSQFVESLYVFKTWYK